MTSNTLKVENMQLEQVEEVRKYAKMQNVDIDWDIHRRGETLDVWIYYKEVEVCYVDLTASSNWQSFREIKAKIDLLAKLQNSGLIQR